MPATNGSVFPAEQVSRICTFTKSDATRLM